MNAIADNLKSITVAGITDKNPLEFKLSKSPPSGIYVELWKIWSKKTGIAVNYIITTADEAERGLKNGSVDVIMGYVSGSEEIQFAVIKDIYLSTIYIYRNENVLVKNVKYATKKTINGVYKAVKPYIPKKIAKGLSKEHKEYKKKGKKGYVKSKYHQVQKKWNKAKGKVKSFNKKYVKPVAHKYLDPIRKTKFYKKVRNAPIIKQGLDYLSKTGKKWHFW